MSGFAACIGRGLLALLAVALMTAPASGQAEPPGVTWDAKINVASGDAHKGPWRMNRSKFLFVDDPTVAINAQGFVGVAWADQSRLDIFFQMYGQDGKKRFEVPVSVSRNPGTFSWLPRLVVADGEAGDVYLLWQEIVFSGGSHGGEIFFARSTDGGKTFDAPANLSKSLEGDGKGRLTQRYWDNGSLDLVMSSKGDLYAAWTEFDGKLWFSRSTDRGKSFSIPIRVSGADDATPARGPSLAVSAAGTVYLAWTVGEDKAANIHIVTSDDAGRTFSTPRVAIKSGGHSDAPKIAVDRAGAVHLVFAESPDGPFKKYHVRYTRSTDGARTFTEPREISRAHAGKFQSVSFPSLSLDDAGNLYVVWELFPNRIDYSRGLGFSYSRDGGQTFATPSIIPGSMDPALGINGSQQGLLMRKLAVNGAAVAVVNSTFKSDRASHIWLFRGKPTWSLDR